MSHTETGVATWRSTITVPDDGDLDNAAAIAVMGEGLSDRTRYLYENLAVNSVTLAGAVTVDRPVPMAPIYNPSHWTPNPGFSDPPTVYTIIGAGTGAEKKWLFLDLAGVLPTTGTILGFSVKYSCADASALPTNPTNRVRAGVWRQDMAGTSVPLWTAAVSMVSDASANLAAYQGIQFLTTTVASHTILTGNNYYLGIRTDENGYGRIYQATIRYSSAVILPGGA